MNYVSKFNILGEEINVKDKEAREDIKKTLANDASRVVTVGAYGAKFTTINHAITHALLFLKASINNPVTILIYPGIYNEQIILSDVHGLSFVGFGIDETIIQYNGSYPNCVVRVEGDISFKNLTIRNTNPSTYAVHSDVLNNNITGVISFENCAIYGGTSAIGYGSGEGVELFVKNCILGGNENILYAHNSAYGGSNQRLTVLNNLFVRRGNENVVMLDDAGYTNGDRVSQMLCTFNGNVFNYQGYGKIVFRKNTSQPGVSYLPINDSNIICGAGNANNSNIEGLNFGRGNYAISCYFTVPTEANTLGQYYVSIPVEVYAPNYNTIINSVTVQGQGDVKGDFTVAAREAHFVHLLTTNSALAGRTLALSMNLIVL